MLRLPNFLSGILCNARSELMNFTKHLSRRFPSHFIFRFHSILFSIEFQLYLLVKHQISPIYRGLPLQDDLIGSSKRQLRPGSSFLSKHLHLPVSNSSTLRHSLLPVHLSSYSSYSFVYSSLQIFIFNFESHCKSDCQTQPTMNLISERGKERNPWIIC